MDFAEMMRVLRRRWRVSLPALVLTVAATVGTYAKWPTTYQATAEISLIGPQSIVSQPANGNNPYLGVGGLGPLAGILAENLSTQQSAQQLDALGVASSLTAAIPPFAAGPFVKLTLTGKNPSAIRTSMPIVINFAAQRLKSIQESGPVKTPEKGLVRDVVIAQASSPAPVLKKKLELVAGVAILGLVLLFMLSFIAEGRAERKAAAREEINARDGSGTEWGSRIGVRRRAEEAARSR